MTTEDVINGQRVILKGHFLIFIVVSLATCMCNPLSWGPSHAHSQNITWSHQLHLLIRDHRHIFSHFLMLLHTKCNSVTAFHHIVTYWLLHHIYEVWNIHLEVQRVEGWFTPSYQAQRTKIKSHPDHLCFEVTLLQNSVPFSVCFLSKYSKFNPHEHTLVSFTWLFNICLQTELFINNRR